MAKETKPSPLFRFIRGFLLLITLFCVIGFFYLTTHSGMVLLPKTSYKVSYSVFALSAPIVSFALLSLISMMDRYVRSHSCLYAFQRTCLRFLWVLVIMVCILIWVVLKNR